MEKILLDDFQTYMVPHGRTWTDSVSGQYRFNWSASGVEFTFTGTFLSALFCADNGNELEGPPPYDEKTPKRATWPIIGVFLDDMPQPIRTFQVSGPHESWLLYRSDDVQAHRFRLIKITENTKSFLGIQEFHAEGKFEQAQVPKKKRLEVVGDSITCGYGNESLDPARGFYSDEENSWMAYSMRTGAALDMETSLISVSGITAVHHDGWPAEYVMEDIYAYTDMPGQVKSGHYTRETCELWDFKAHHNDFVVINLGTNDAFATLFSPDTKDEENFAGKYLSFLKKVRGCNGPDTIIVCALGSMNYYLYDRILEAVAQYRKETEDSKVYTFKFRPMHPMDGIGASGHPSMSTHQKMAAELTDFLKTLL
ncbi:Lysophospholipase L1 [Lachnospiraceae bacterium NK3A20]|nr:Lysophospholipase L1 [Lachnospiraceae bacterium NK3A20]